MASISVIALACMVAVSQAFFVAPAQTAGTDTTNDMCHGLECPKYTVLNKTADWELRRYAATKWSATNGTAMTKDTINSELFRSLFEYISGKNEKNTKIDMTAPVLTKVIHGAGPNCESDFTMHFMLPFAYWSAPLKPTDPKVFIAETPSMDVYVKTFGGFANDDDYVQALTQLSEALEKAGIPVEDKFFFEAGYDGPYTFRDRHNEVWILKQ